MFSVFSLIFVSVKIIYKYPLIYENSLFCSQDLLAVCRQLNLEHCVGEIMEQLGADENGRISYSEFLRRRMQLINEINALTLQEQARERDSIQSGNGRHSITMQQASPAPGSSSTGNWPTSSDSQGLILRSYFDL